MPTKERAAKEKLKQNHLAGMEPPTIAEVDQAAELYYDRIADSFKLRAKCDDAKNSLLEVMAKHKLTRYEYEDKEVLVIDKLTVKVKRKKEEE